MLAGMIITGLLNYERASRLVAFANRQENPFTFSELVQEMIAGTWSAREPLSRNLADLQRITQRLVLDSLLGLVREPKSTPEVRAIASWHLEQLLKLIAAKKSDDPIVQAHLQSAARDIRYSLEHPIISTSTPQVPPLPAANLTGGPQN